ncbi:MAG TPA: type II secretion system F family protein [Gemmataceae bacterium]|nr:type II secretion system F family protein [Gemmataceae bacterium]
MLAASVGFQDIIPLLVFGGVVLLLWGIMNLLAERNSRSSERLMRHSRPASLADIEDPKVAKKGERFQTVTDMAKAISQPLMPQTELEQSALRVKLANAGFRSESAAAVYSGLRLASVGIFTLIALAVFLPKEDTLVGKGKWIALIAIFGFFLPTLILWWIRRNRQLEIFLTLPDALDLMVVCVESGLGLDAAMRKVCEEMKGHAKVLCEEIGLANLQLQMGRPKREVLHDLGVRTGVDDVKSLAAILIQADRFGSSVAQALRVQSDSMRTRRRQLAEEKAAKTAVQMIFPLVLFIFPGIFVVLVGPAALAIANQMLKNQ